MGPRLRTYALSYEHILSCRAKPTLPVNTILFHDRTPTPLPPSARMNSTQHLQGGDSWRLGCSGLARVASEGWWAFLDTYRKLCVVPTREAGKFSKRFVIEGRS